MLIFLTWNYIYHNRLITANLFQLTNEQVNSSAVVFSCCFPSDPFDCLQMFMHALFWQHWLKLGWQKHISLQYYTWLALPVWLCWNSHKWCSVAGSRSVCAHLCPNVQWGCVKTDWQKIHRFGFFSFFPPKTNKSWCYSLQLVFFNQMNQFMMA